MRHLGALAIALLTTICASCDRGKDTIASSEGQATTAEQAGS
jgi:hypothetical protein